MTTLPAFPPATASGLPDDRVQWVTEVAGSKVLIDVATLETLAHGVEFARDVAQTLYVHFNDPAMARTQEKIREAQKEAMRLVGLARRPR